MWVTLPDMAQALTWCRFGRVPGIPCAGEIEMKALLAIATLLLVCSAAQAQYTIEYDGHTIRIDPDRGTVSIPGVYDNTGKKTKRGRSNPDNQQKQTPAQQQTTIERQPSSDSPPKPSIQDVQTPTPTVQPSIPANAAPAATATNQSAKDNVAPAPLAPLQQGPPSIAPSPAPTLAIVPPPPAPTTAAPVVRPQTPAPTTATAPPPSPLPPPRPQVPAATVATIAPVPAVPDPNSPVGIWLTEEKEGKVRIEPCGTYLCGYSLDSKSNANGEQVLINMKPGKDQKWAGRIHDPNTGSDYESTIALKGKDELRVQGCAFGGMFCGGQTWTRLN